MKKNILRSLIAFLGLALSLTLISCKKEEKEETPTVDYESILNLYIFEKDGSVVTDDFTLPTTISGQTATWTSNKETIALTYTEVKDANDNVTETYYEAEVGNPETGREEVTLTLTIGGKSKTYTLYTRAIDVYDIADDYTFTYDKKTIESAFDLDTEHEYKGKTATITWSVADDGSTDEEKESEISAPHIVVDNNRCYVVCGNDYPEVKIKATFTYNGESADYTYRMNVNGSVSSEAKTLENVVGSEEGFQLGMYNTSLKTYYYSTGVLSGYYGATVTDYTKAINFYLDFAVKTPAVYYTQAEVEAAKALDPATTITTSTVKTAAIKYTAEDTETYKYIVYGLLNEGETTEKKVYLNMTKSGTHYNASFDETSSSIYAIEENTLKVNLGTTEAPDYAFFGTYSTYTTIGGCAWEKLASGNYAVHLYECDEDDSTPTDKVAYEKTHLAITNTNISENTTLPTASKYKDVDITWSIETAVEGQEVKNNVLKITRGDADVTVKLIATLRCGEASTVVQTETYTVTVLKKYDYTNDGTAEHPYTIEEAMEFYKENAGPLTTDSNSTYTTKKVYITGVVSGSVSEYAISGSDPATNDYTLYIKDGDNSIKLQYVLLGTDVVVPVENDTVVVYGYLEFYNSLSVYPKDKNDYKTGEFPIITSVVRGTSTITVDEDSADYVIELSKTSGLNGSEFTFKVNYVLQTNEEINVTVNNTVVEAENDVYTATISGNTTIKVSIIKPIDSYTLAIKANASNNAYASMYDITVDGIDWKFPGNQYTDNLSRIGGKNLTNADRYFYSKTAIKCDVKKITLTHGTASDVTVNSLTLKVYSTADDAANDTNAIATLTGTFTENGTTVFENTSSTSWYNCYYRVVYNLTIGSKNKYVGFVSMKLEK